MIIEYLPRTALQYQLSTACYQLGPADRRQKEAMLAGWTPSNSSAHRLPQAGVSIRENS